MYTPAYLYNAPIITKIGGRPLLADTNKLLWLQIINLGISCILREEFNQIRYGRTRICSKMSNIFREVRFWGIQTQNSVETLFLSERANIQLSRTSKIFEIGAIFMKLEWILY